MQLIKKSRLLTFVLLLPLGLQTGPAFSQASGPVSIGGTVRTNVTINISAINGTNNSDIFLTAVPLGGKRIRVELKGTGPATAEKAARMTVQLRSNAAYRMNAALLESTGYIDSASIGLGNLTASGQRTSPTAVTNSRIPAAFDAKNQFSAENTSILTQPQMILSGPRISMGGGPLASTNALNVDLTFAVTAKAGQPWSIYLELSVAPALE